MYACACILILPTGSMPVPATELATTGLVIAMFSLDVACVANKLVMSKRGFMGSFCRQLLSGSLAPSVRHNHETMTPRITRSKSGPVDAMSSALNSVIAVDSSPSQASPSPTPPCAQASPRTPLPKRRKVPRCIEKLHGEMGTGINNMTPEALRQTWGATAVQQLREQLQTGADASTARRLSRPYEM